MKNVRCFKVSQKFDVNGNRATTIHDLRNNKKVKIKDTYKDDSEEISEEFLKKKGIEVVSKFEFKKDLYLISDNFDIMIK